MPSGGGSSQEARALPRESTGDGSGSVGQCEAALQERRHVWKIEGVDAREDAEMLAQQTRRGEGRENVKSVLLGRGASDAKVDHWLQQAAPVEGFIGFAIGRSIWWNALKGFLEGDLDRETAASQVADNYLRFVKVYDDAESGVRV